MKLYQFSTIFFRYKEQREYFLNHSEGQHYPNTKPRQKYHKKKRMQTNISYKHRCKTLQQNIRKFNTTIYEEYYTTWPIRLLKLNQIEDQFNFQNNIIHQMYRLKKKNHFIISIDVKSIYKIQHPFMIKSEQTRNRRGCL